MAKAIERNANEEITLQQEDIPTRATARKIYGPDAERKKRRDEENNQSMPIINPKRTVEVMAKPKPRIEEIEKIEYAPKQKKKRKIPRSDSGVVVKSRESQIENLEGNSILVVTEKPQAAEKISLALSDGRAKKYTDNGVAFYEFEKGGERIIVACAVGHLFSLSQDVKGSDYPIFQISWKPNYEVRKRDFTKKYYSNLSKLIKRAREIIIATDYDVEGEVIGYNIVRFIGHQKDAKRMKFSSLTAKELKEAFENASNTINWGQAIAGETRHYIDWYYGINLSRALMRSIKAGGRFKIMSIGRVQGPALNLIVKKEKEIQAFKSRGYWKVFIDAQEKKDKTNITRLRNVKDIFVEKELEKFNVLKGKEGEAATEKHEQSIQPPHPFDLTTLQIEAYKFCSITPARTLQIAQGLYLAGLISYPRTSSQKIPEAINPKDILKRLSEFFNEVKFATRANPVEGKKTDPAHPSIYPTGEFQELDGEEKKVYQLIARRFIACFCADAQVENKTLTLTSNNLVFKTRGLEIKENGWMTVYQTTLQEKKLRDMNGKAIITRVDLEEDETQPPRRYSQASIVSELEKRGLGTKATRANILETLYDRNYITDNKSIKATPLGINLIDTLEKYSPVIIDEKLTHDIEKETEKMQLSKKQESLKKEQENVLGIARNAIEKISSDFKKNEIKIGKELVKATEDSWKKEQKDNELMLCPACKKGMLTIKFSPKFKRSFIACNAYPECKTTFSLPPNGLIKKTDKICDECEFPLLMRLSKGKRPWLFCFNPSCPTRTQEGVYVKAKKDGSVPNSEASKEDQEDNQESKDSDSYK